MYRHRVAIISRSASRSVHATGHTCWLQCSLHTQRAADVHLCSGAITSHHNAGARSADQPLCSGLSLQYFQRTDIGSPVVLQRRADRAFGGRLTLFKHTLAHSRDSSSLQQVLNAGEAILLLQALVVLLASSYETKRACCYLLESDLRCRVWSHPPRHQQTLPRCGRIITTRACIRCDCPQSTNLFLLTPARQQIRLLAAARRPYHYKALLAHSVVCNN